MHSLSPHRRSLAEAAKVISVSPEDENTRHPQTRCLQSPNGICSVGQTGEIGFA